MGLVLSVASAAFGAYLCSRKIKNNEIPKAFLILGIVFLITAVARELDAGFWQSLGLR
jgi:hypothetical protein